MCIRDSVFLNIYLQVQNLLDAQNIIAVYKATGNPDDDGYLAAATSQNNINSQIDPQAFRDLYDIKVNNPDHYNSVSYTHLRAHETPEHLVCRLLLEKKKTTVI